MDKGVSSEMNNKITYDELCLLVENILELEPGVVSGQSKDWYNEWDSLGHLGILVALDKRLNGRCKDIRELGSTASIDYIYNVLKDNGLAD